MLRIGAKRNLLYTNEVEQCVERLALAMCLYPKEISVYKQHAQAGRVCLLGGVIMHNAERTSHSASAIVAKKMVYPGWCTNRGPMRDVLQAWTTLCLSGTFPLDINMHKDILDEIHCNR